MTPPWFAALALALGPGGEVVAADCARLAPEITQAAEEADLPLTTMVALVATESRCLFVEGARWGTVGPTQVHWDTWGPLLAPEGWYDAELLGPWGVLAGGRVLAALRDRWTPPTDSLLLCLYSDGAKALRYQTDCTYSRTVEGLARRLK